MGLHERENKRISAAEKMISPITEPANTEKIDIVTLPQETVSLNNVVVPVIKETRNIKVNFLLTPSTSAKVKKKCKELGISVNECVNQILDAWASQ